MTFKGESGLLYSSVQFSAKHHIPSGQNKDEEVLFTAKCDVGENLHQVDGLFKPRGRSAELYINIFPTENQSIKAQTDLSLSYLF